ncbi:hypothetical protein HHI36_021587 [Cryptolaemus montrouzieri]|uniref:Uncharacterized protein n=1 Tax=Cryptolaemus montrouzieri TaxID=559131 RepID=A0ABD2MXK9_9CUCU
MSESMRKSFTLLEKYEIIRALEEGKTQNELSRERNLSRSTIATIWKNKDLLLDAIENKNSNIRRLRKPQHDDVDQFLKDWFLEQTLNNVKVSDSDLKMKAQDLGREFSDGNDFLCSDGWINRWKQRHMFSDSMPLQQRLTMAGNKVPQDDSLLAPTLKSQPLSPTKLKVTRHAAAAEEKIETPHTALLEEVCLRWNSHHSNMQTAFPSLLSKEQYCDVTLVADGKSLKCHKLILSSCSSYFDQVLEKIMPYQHPVIFMKDIPFNILKSLCDFMYAGEVNILQSDLDQLLAVGESLKIKGLANRSEPDTVNIPSPKDPVEEVSEAPLSKSTKSTVRPSTSEKKSLPRTKELVDRVTDPLDLMEPTYEEEATPDLPPAVLKRNDQTRKSTGKRVRKRKHVENDHEPSPPIFQTRKGTRSRPNVKVPRYFNASFDNSNDKTAVADTSSEIHQGSEEAMVDPLLDMVEEIKTEPVDIEDGLISYGEESYDMGEEPASTTGLFKKINSASAKLIVTKQEKEDAPDPLNTEQVDDRPKQVEEKGVENNNGEEDASGVIGETQTTLTQENSTTENERAEENAVHENLVENNVQDEEMGQMTTLSIAGTFDAVDQSQESAT